MLTAIKKSLYSADPNIFGHGTHITNATCFDQNSILVSTTNTNSSLNIIKTKTQHNGLTKLIETNLESVPVSVNAKFVTKLQESPNELCYVPKSQFSITLLHKNRLLIEQKNFVIDGDINLRENVVKVITDKYSDVCKCSECYHLVGFIQICEFNMIVQLLCNHGKSQRKIFIMQSSMENIEEKKYISLKHTTVLNVIDFYRLCKNNKIHRDISTTSVITSVVTNGYDQLYFSSSYGKRGHLWSVPYFFGLNFFGVPTLLSKLNHSPRGVCLLKHDDNYVYDECDDDTNKFEFDKHNKNFEKLLVVCDSKVKFTYYNIIVKKEDNCIII
jgi:hypothetical protein